MEHYIVILTYVAMYRLGLTFIPIEGMMKQLIGFTQLNLHHMYYRPKILQSNNRLSIINKHT